MFHLNLKVDVLNFELLMSLQIQGTFFPTSRRVLIRWYNEYAQESSDVSVKANSNFFHRVRLLENQSDSLKQRTILIYQQQPIKSHLLFDCYYSRA